MASRPKPVAAALVNKAAGRDLSPGNGLGDIRLLGSCERRAVEGNTVVAAEPRSGTSRA